MDGARERLRREELHEILWVMTNDALGRSRGMFARTWTLICPPPGIRIIRVAEVGGTGGGYCGGGPISRIGERCGFGSVALFRRGEGEELDGEDRVGMDFW